MFTIKSIAMGLVMLITINSFAGDPIFIPKSKFSSTFGFQQRQQHSQSIMLSSNYVVPKEKKKEFVECAYLKNKEIAGFILFPIGLGAMAGGGYMAYVGGRNIYNS